ncbi:conserved Plasmodium protein, unknown function [Plasmodium vinckei lentum]|uniref:Uncharacterized protein n=1 Tax=Plasmodium vinckei lentum TaxID=138297 RepID=A0A6V7S0S5_PLAVN|nr:conserved Plasmodium protein, unknown function [Plasmodium vinckei lentum]
MSYGCGTVCLPVIRRALLFFMGVEATYCTYELFLKPGTIYAYYRFNDIVSFNYEIYDISKRLICVYM